MGVSEEVLPGSGRDEGVGGDNRFGAITGDYNQKFPLIKVFGKTGPGIFSERLPVLGAFQGSKLSKSKGDGERRETSSGMEEDLWVSEHLTSGVKAPREARP